MEFRNRSTRNLFSIALSASLATALVSATGAQAISTGQPVRYDGQRIVRVELEELADLNRMRASGARLLSCREDFGAVDYLVSEAQLEFVEAGGLDVLVLDGDVQASVEAERERLSAPAQASDPGAPGGWFDDFKDLDAIEARMFATALARPDLVTLEDIGDSLEGRDLWMLRITGPGADKPGVLLNGTQHAREWLSPMSLMYVVDQLLEDYDTDPEVRALIDGAELFVLPVVNPDGYEYSWTTDRFWRKNRRPLLGGLCDGVDLNRNWSVAWGLDEGSSGDMCDETYRGAGPFSEPESAALAQFVTAHPEIVANIDLHAYSRMLLTPTGHSPGGGPDGALFHDLAVEMHAEMFAVNGRHYAFGGIQDMLYPVSGAMTDWSYEQGQMLAFTVELPPGPGKFLEGFDPPPAEILSTGEEQYRAVRWLLGAVRRPQTVSFQEERPALVPAGESQSLAVRIRPLAASAILPAASELHVRVGQTGAFQSFPLEALGEVFGAHEFLATLPGAASGDVIEYYVRAESAEGEASTSPVGAPAEVHRTTAFDVVQRWSFDTDPGWTTEGDWEFGVPSGQGGGSWQGNPDPTAGATGDNVYGTNLDGNTPADIAFHESLTTTAIDCSGLSNVQLRFQRYLNIAPYYATHASVGVSADGVSWTTVWQSAGQVQDSAWTQQSVDLSHVADGQPAVFVRWSLGTSLGDQGFSGWNLDDVELWAGSTAVSSWNNYGVGFPGNLGSLPYLTAWDPPVRGRKAFVEVQNPFELETPGWLVVGFADAALPSSLGGTLWLQPELVLPFQLPSDGRLFLLEVPTSAALNQIFLQAVQLDPFQPGGFAFSQGLRLHLADQ